MKYRIIFNGDSMHPYVVQCKRWRWQPIWLKVTMISYYSTMSEAEDFLRKLVENRAKTRAGTVLFEYDESDLLMEKLRK